MHIMHIYKQYCFTSQIKALSDGPGKGGIQSLKGGKCKTESVGKRGPIFSSLFGFASDMVLVDLVRTAFTYVS